LHRYLFNSANVFPMKSPLPRIGLGFLTRLTVLFLSTFLGSSAATPTTQFNIRDYGAVGDGHQLEGLKRDRSQMPL
jgi:hypothetical protein